MIRKCDICGTEFDACDRTLTCSPTCYKKRKGILRREYYARTIVKQRKWGRENYHKHKEQANARRNANHQKERRAKLELAAEIEQNTQEMQAKLAAKGIVRIT